MKRFHVHLHVDDLAKNIGFYSQLFAQEPARVESDYAKWMLDDPPVNFAISTRGAGRGVDHFGIQADSAEELEALKSSAETARLVLEDQGGNILLLRPQREILDHRSTRVGVGTLSHARHHSDLWRVAWHASQSGHRTDLLCAAGERASAH